MKYYWIFITFLTALSPLCYTQTTSVKNTTISNNKTTPEEPRDNKTTTESAPQKSQVNESRIEIARRLWAWRSFNLGAVKEEEPDPERGPFRDSNYDPSYGHEPYWHRGDWVYSPPTTRPTRYPNEKTSAPRDSNCGLKCGVVYKTYGPVCGRSKYFDYKSFVSYCELKSEDCEGEDEWRMLYRGPCRRATVMYRTSIIYRAPDFIQKFIDDHPKTFPFVATNVGFPGPITEKAAKKQDFRDKIMTG